MEFNRMEKWQDKLHVCIRCGYCFEFCHIFKVTGWESDTPRGKLIMLHGMMNGYLNPSEAYDTITSLSWSVPETGQTFVGDTVQIEFLVSGKYTLNAMINGEAEVSFGSDINVYDSPQSDFTYSFTSANSVFNYFFEAENIVNSPGISYEWYINNELEGNSPELVYIFDLEGNYLVQLKVMNEYSCESLSSQEIIVSDNLQCPNVFTPNMDGYNDFFRVNTDGTTVYTFQVYSRAGIKVYQSESPSIFWDGRSLSGIEMQSGLYFYLIEPVKRTEKEKISGFVHLIR